jgi:uncharacterized protein
VVRAGASLLLVLTLALPRPGPATPGLPAAGSVTLENRLAGHPSAYLAMHADDPVAWQDWGADAMATARATDLLLLISSGYFACHWCHVMQHESYRNADIAALLNAGYVPVKIDRELHGALDSYLIDFVERTQGRPGWPLNVILTPDGHPLIGVTYLPPDGFKDFLARVAAAWGEDRDAVGDLARQAAQQLLRERRPVVPDSQPPEIIDRSLLDQAMAMADTLGGGFGEANRFPKAPQLDALLELQARRPDPSLADFLRLTLDNIAGEGLRDHVGGGFFRYTEDPSWAVPHFEKMLYTQALLADVFMRAADLLEEPFYDEVARDTVAFLLRDMVGEQGGFVSSFSALDDEGIEGGSYLVPTDRLAPWLGDIDADIARRYWRLHGSSPFDGGHLPRRGETPRQIADRLGMPVAAVRERIAASRQRLLAIRAGRGLPLDPKELAGWNGLVLATLTRAAARWGDPAIAAAAEATYRLLRDDLWDGTRLHRALHGGRPFGKADMSDYAYVANGIRRYADWAGTEAGVEAGVDLADTLLSQAWQRFHGEDGWRLDADPLIPLAGGGAAIRDDVLPSPSALLIRLSLESTDPAIQRRGRAAAEAARGEVQRDPFFHVGHLAVLRVARAGQPGEGPAAGG